MMGMFEIENSCGEAGIFICSASFYLTIPVFV